MGRINVPAGGGKREKTLLNGKSSGTFVKQENGIVIDRFLGKSKDESLIVFRGANPTNQEKYALVYNWNGEKQAAFRIGEVHAAYIESEEQIFFVGVDSVYEYSFSGNLLGSYVLTGSRNIVSAFFYDGIIYTVELTKASATNTLFFAKYGLYGDELDRTATISTNLTSYSKNAIWVISDTDEKVIFEHPDKPARYLFDYRRKIYEPVPKNSLSEWALEDNFLIGTRYCLPDLFKTKSFSLTLVSNPIFDSESNKYIFFAKMYQKVEGEKDPVIAFFIDRKNIHDVETRYIKNVGETFGFWLMNLNPQGLLLYKEILRNPQFLSL